MERAAQWECMAHLCDLGASCTAVAEHGRSPRNGKHPLVCSIGNELRRGVAAGLKLPFSRSGTFLVSIHLFTELHLHAPTVSALAASDSDTGKVICHPALCRLRKKRGNLILMGTHWLSMCGRILLRRCCRQYSLLLRTKAVKSPKW